MDISDLLEPGWSVVVVQGEFRARAWPATQDDRGAGVWILTKRIPAIRVGQPHPVPQSEEEELSRRDVPPEPPEGQRFTLAFDRVQERWFIHTLTVTYARTKDRAFLYGVPWESTIAKHAIHPVQLIVRPLRLLAALSTDALCRRPPSGQGIRVGGTLAPDAHRVMPELGGDATVEATITEGGVISAFESWDASGNEMLTIDASTIAFDQDPLPDRIREVWRE